MTTLTLTLPTGKAGQQATFTIQFNVSNFDAVIESVSELKSVEDLYSSNLWKVI